MKNPMNPMFDEFLDNLAMVLEREHDVSAEVIERADELGKLKLRCLAGVGPGEDDTFVGMLADDEGVVTVEFLCNEQLPGMEEWETFVRLGGPGGVVMIAHALPAAVMVACY